MNQWNVCAMCCTEGLSALAQSETKQKKIINFESRERSECTCRANICCQRFMPRRVIHLEACLSCTKRFFNSQHISWNHMAVSASSSPPFPCRTAHAECFVSITQSFSFLFNFRVRRKSLQTRLLTSLWCDCCFAFAIRANNSFSIKIRSLARFTVASVVGERSRVAGFVKIEIIWLFVLPIFCGRCLFEQHSWFNVLAMLETDWTEFGSRCQHFQVIIAFTRQSQLVGWFQLMKLNFPDTRNGFANFLLLFFFRILSTWKILHRKFELLLLINFSV